MLEIRKNEIVNIENILDKETLNSVLKEIETHGCCDSSEVDFKKKLLRLGMDLVEDFSVAYDEGTYYTIINGQMYKIKAYYEIGKIDTDMFATDSYYIDECSGISFEKVKEYKIVDKRRIKILVDVDFDKTNLEEIEELLRKKCDFIEFSK